jgi:transcription elongation GreA/GreB family factor
MASKVSIIPDTNRKLYLMSIPLNSFPNRAAILAHCQELLSLRKAEYLHELENLNEAASGEVKSSAGDKYETGREMIAQSRNIIERNLGETISHLETLLRMTDIPDADTREAGRKIKFGSLIETDKDWYFLGMSLGEIVFKGNAIKMISFASPIGMLLRGHTIGTELDWRGSKLKIMGIY